MKTHINKLVQSVITMAFVAVLTRPGLSVADQYACNVASVTDPCGQKAHITCSVEVLVPSYGTECAPADPESIMTCWTICTTTNVEVYDEITLYRILPEGCDWNQQTGYSYIPDNATCDLVVLSGNRCPIRE